ncbi:hypothetical protein QZH41_004196 [Actinostola sp. cb2023]|nr:hypothetical protein QZH41_004196 [Actinostola sp. cb2023]
MLGYRTVIPYHTTSHSSDGAAAADDDDDDDDDDGDDDDDDDDLLHDYIREDPRAHYELIHTWLYQEQLMQEIKMEEGYPLDMTSYDECLCTVLEGLQHRMDPKDKLFTRVVLEAPLVTERVMDMVKLHCENLDSLQVGFATLRDLIIKRPATQHEHLQTLLELTTNDRDQVRVQAIHSAKKLHTRPDLALDIEHLRPSASPPPTAPPPKNSFSSTSSSTTSSFCLTSSSTFSSSTTSSFCLTSTFSFSTTTSFCLTSSFTFSSSTFSSSTYSSSTPSSFCLTSSYPTSCS